MLTLSSQTLEGPSWGPVQALGEPTQLFSVQFCSACPKVSMEVAELSEEGWSPASKPSPRARVHLAGLMSLGAEHPLPFE